MTFLVVLGVNAIAGLVAASVWRRKGGRYGTGLVFGLLGGVFGLAFVLRATPEPGPPAGRR